MFDISFGEFLLIGLVALVVLGPERLPTVARTLGALLGRAQRFVASVKSDIQQQADFSSLTSLKQEVQETAYALRAQFESELNSTQAELLTMPEIRSPQVSATADADPDLPVHNENQLELFADLDTLPPPHHPPEAHQ